MVRESDFGWSVQGLGFRVQDSGFRVQSAGCRVLFWSAGYGVQSYRFKS